MKENGIEKYIKVISNCGLFNGMSSKECVSVYSEATPRIEKYARDEIIVREGEYEREFGIVVSGLLRGEKFHMEGAVHIVNVFETGDIFSMDSVVSKSKIAPITIIAADDAEIMAIDVEKLLSCRLHEQIMRNIIELLADENIKKLYKIDILSHAGLRDKILTYLKIMAQKRRKNTFHTMMTQEQLAQYLAVNRSALSNELNKMRREGILDFKKDKFTLI